MNAIIKEPIFSICFGELTQFRKVIQLLIARWSHYKDQDLESSITWNAALKGVDVILSTCDYTGDDGFELSIPSSYVERFAQLDSDTISVL